MSNTEDAKLVEQLCGGIVYRHQQYDQPDHTATEAIMTQAAATIERLRARETALLDAETTTLRRAEKAEMRCATARSTAFREAAEVVKAHRQKMPFGIVDDREWDGIQANNSACDAIASAIDAKAKEDTHG